MKQTKGLLSASAVAATSLGFLTCAGVAQEDPSYIFRTPTYPVFYNPEPYRYNLKWGRLTGRFRASIQAEANDNITLSDHNRQSDLILSPEVGVGFFWPLSKINVLQFDLGVGYRAYVNHSELSTLTLSPNSAVRYRIVLEDIQFNFQDSFSIQVDPIDRPDLSAGQGGAKTSLFRRIYNTSGVTGEWQPRQHLDVFAGYDFLLDQTLSDAFKYFDHETHSFTGGAKYTLSSSLLAGLQGSYALTYYTHQTQSDSDAYTVAPYLVYKPTQHLTFDALVGYSAGSFERRTFAFDDLNYGGVTAQVGLKHQLNSRTTQEIRLSKTHDLGIGHNFNDIFSAQYSLNLRINSSVNAYGKAMYENYRASGRLGEHADRYLLYAGMAYQMSNLWRLGLAYAVVIRESSLRDNSYVQSRLVLDLTRRF